MKADLHMHTTCSDGHDTPDELIQKIVTSDLEMVALTDHDRVTPVSFLDQLRSRGIITFPASEISTRICGGAREDKIVHMTSYAPHFSDKVRQVLNQSCEVDEIRMRERVSKLQAR